MHLKEKFYILNFPEDNTISDFFCTVLKGKIRKKVGRVLPVLPLKLTDKHAIAIEINITKSFLNKYKYFLQNI